MGWEILLESGHGALHATVHGVVPCVMCVLLDALEAILHDCARRHPSLVPRSCAAPKHSVIQQTYPSVKSPHVLCRTPSKHQPSAAVDVLRGERERFLLRWRPVGGDEFLWLVGRFLLIRAALIHLSASPLIPWSASWPIVGRRATQSFTVALYSPCVARLHMAKARILHPLYHIASHSMPSSSTPPRTSQNIMLRHATPASHHTTPLPPPSLPTPPGGEGIRCCSCTLATT